MRVLFFFLHNPIPPVSGCHQRALQMIQGMISQGDEVFLASAELYTETPWTESSIQTLHEMGVAGTFIYSLSRVDRGELIVMDYFQRIRGTRKCFRNAIPIPHGLRNWFGKLQQQLAAEVAVVTYCWFEKLVRSIGDRALKVVDNQGLFSINNMMEGWIETELKKFRNGLPFAEELFSLSLIQSIETSVDTAELEMYRQFDQIITLSAREYDVLSKAMPEKVHSFIPLTMQPTTTVLNQYDGPPVTVAGANYFNQHGIELFGQRILPKIRESLPSFSVDVFGTAAGSCLKYDGLDYRGFVAELNEAYTHAAFSICMTVCGTGQQVKVVEAMANGLAVVVPHTAAAGTLVRDRENGFIVSDETEFRDRICELTVDRSLCRKMGENAIDTVREHSKSLWDFRGLWGQNIAVPRLPNLQGSLKPESSGTIKCELE
jgi:hypothetical protein